ncbi:MAG: hypothetical protein LBB59_07490 [Campylobacteraceae bacterium]|nr:hypothetical protein [Campylobacteraceae bacterium]
MKKSYKAAFIYSALLSAILTGCGNGSTKDYPDNKIMIKSIAAGRLHSFAFDDEGKIYAAGRNIGALGLEAVGKVNRFTEVTDLRDKNITAIAAGDDNSFAFGGGRIYGAGYNDNGQLGLGDKEVHSRFTEVTDLRDKNITAIVSKEYSLALSANGEVYIAGLNDNGWFGMGDDANHTVFTEVTDLRDKNIAAIATGYRFSLALCANGAVYAAGKNNNGQLGLGDNIDRAVFTEVTDLRDKNITAIFTGDKHALAFSNNGKIYAAGNNINGQLGFSDKQNRNIFTEITDLEDKNITAAAINYYHSFIVSENGAVYAVGDNRYGQLGLSDAHHYVFTEVPFGLNGD